MGTDEQHAAAELLGELRALRRREERLRKAKRALIAEARRHHRSWTDIGEALGVSKEAVFGLYKDELRRVQAEPPDPDALSNEEALELERREAEILRLADSAERS